MADNDESGIIVGSSSDPINNPIKADDYVVAQEDPLALSIKDSDLVKILDKRIKDSEKFFNSKYNLKERRKQNEKYYFGRQIDETKLRGWNARYADNVLWESENVLKSLVLSKLPDFVVKPGNDTPESADIAKDLGDAVTDTIHKREQRRVLGLAFKHLPVYFTGVIKYFWNPELGSDGDYQFTVVHPENIVIDQFASSNNADEMAFVAEAVELTVKEVIIRFPDKKQALIDELEKTGKFTRNTDELTESQLASPIKIWETWFTWYVQRDGGEKWERVEGVMWKFEGLLLKKQKNPNFDYEGKSVSFTYDQQTGAKRKVTPEDLQNAMMMGQELPIKKEKVYYNYFDSPEKPYIFLGYDQWGKIGLDETTRIEQNLYLQMNVDKRGRQIVEILDRARGKHVFSTDSGLKAEDIEDMDMSDPEQDLLVAGPVNTSHSFIQPEYPGAPVFQDYSASRERVFQKYGVNAARGEIQTSTATGSQIAREANFNTADDLAEDTVSYSSEKMARAVLQMIKLRYTEDHLTRIIGSDGKAVFLKLNRDMIEDGMEVKISASGTDKLKAQKNATDMAQMKLIDPINYYKDMGLNDPIGRAKMLVEFMVDPNAYLVKYGEGLDTTDKMAQALNPGQPQPGGMPPEGMAPPPGPQAPPPMIPQQPSPENPQAVAANPPVAAPPQGSPRVL